MTTAVPATVHVVIPVHNRAQMTLECIETLETQSYSPVRIVVVDDGSSDGTAELVLAAHPSVTIVPGDGSLWWTGATNIGVSRILESCAEHDYVLTLNNDTLVKREYVARLVSTELSRPRSLVGSVAVDSRDWDTIVDGGAWVSWVTAKYRWPHRGTSLEQMRGSQTPVLAVDVLSGRGTLVPVRAYREVGMYYPGLPQYGADYEFSRRAARAGWNLVVDYGAVVASHVEATGVTADTAAAGWQGIRDLFASRRSSSSLKYRWRYARRVVAPGWAPVFFLCDCSRVVFSAIRGRLGRAGGSGDVQA